MNKINRPEQEIKEFLLEVEKNESSDFQYSRKVHSKINRVINNIEKFTTTNLSRNYMNMIILLNRLSFSNFCKMHAYIDSKYPGISFHYVMEARQEVINNLATPNYTRYNNNEVVKKANDFRINECSVYLARLKLLQSSKIGNVLALIVAPMRARLIAGLLEDTLDIPKSAILENGSSYLTYQPDVLEEHQLMEILEDLEEISIEQEINDVYSTES